MIKKSKKPSSKKSFEELMKAVKQFELQYNLSNQLTEKEKKQLYKQCMALFNN